MRAAGGVPDGESWLHAGVPESVSTQTSFEERQRVAAAEEDQPVAKRVVDRAVPDTPAERGAGGRGLAPARRRGHGERPEVGPRSSASLLSYASPPWTHITCARGIDRRRGIPARRRTVTAEVGPRGSWAERERPEADPSRRPRCRCSRRRPPCGPAARRRPPRGTVAATAARRSGSAPSTRARRGPAPRRR